MIEQHSVLAVITARGGSKGLPGKNIRNLAGKPLIQWTIDAAKESIFIDRLILSSDSVEIIEAAEKVGCEAPFVRSENLATDHATTIDVIIDALDRVPGYQIVVVLQPTSPLRVTQDIDDALRLLCNSNAPACVSVRPAEEHPFWTFRIGPDHQLTAYAKPESALPLRRQDLPEAWCLNGAVYAAKTEWLKASRSFLTDETVAISMPSDRSIDIDDESDLVIADKILRDRIGN
ncbi:cytidylyltransferase domain-containing protein [Sedimenticola sp.]|uniref:acylneuraminate cytidylyltransferase family protein n=1 Tax=Sedimenticola sp. TaxID=1940285 RepID=UPI003D145CDF